MSFPALAPDLWRPDRAFVCHPGMTFDSLKGVVEARPFKAYTLNLADRRASRIENPDTCAFLGTGRTFFMAHPF